MTAPPDIGTLARLIRKRRIQLGYSQTAAAKHAGISRRVWNEIELGHRSGSPETMHKIDAVLDLPDGSLTALLEAKSMKRGTGELAAIRRDLIRIIDRLTVEDLSHLRIVALRAEHAALQAQLEQYENAIANPTPPAKRKRRAG